MTITLDIRPEVQAELARQASLQGQTIETMAAALLEDAIQVPGQHLGAPADVVEACERLKNFGKRHGILLGGLTLHDLRDEARPSDSL